MNIVKYILELIRAVLSGEKVINPMGSIVASPPTVETKVVAAANGALAGNLLGSLVRLLPLPEWVKRLVLLALPVIGAGAAGYLAPHTNRVLPGVTTTT